MDSWEGEIRESETRGYRKLENLRELGRFDGMLRISGSPLKL